MAFAVYKPGQGYWTRVLTAIGAGVLVLAGVVWIWEELGAKDWRVPVNHDLSLTALTADADRIVQHLGLEAPGGEPGSKSNSVKVTAVASGSAFDSAGMQRNDVITHVDGKPVGDVDAIVTLLQVASSPVLTVQRGYSITLYVQAGVAVVILAACSLVIWRVLNRPRTVDFMIATEAEMNKVNWPSRQEIVGSTRVVIIGTALLTLMLFVVNMIFTVIFKGIGILE